MYWRSLQVKLVATYVLLCMLLLTVTVAVFSAAFSGYVRQANNDRFLQMVEQAQRFVLQEAQAPEEYEASLQAIFPDLVVRLVYRVPMYGSASAVPDQFRIAPGETPTSRVIAIPNNAQYGLALSPKLPERPAWLALSRGIIIFLSCGLIFALVAGFWFARSLATPIHKLGEAMSRVAAGSFEEQVPLTGTPELDAVARQFNRMTDHLRGSFLSLQAERDRANRFPADATHEMNTPLATLRAYHELAVAEPARAPRLFPIIGKQIERIERIMSGLLQMSTVVAGGSSDLEVLDLVTAVAAMEPEMRTRCNESEHAFHMKMQPGPIVVAGNLSLVELVMRNLVDNACKFTPRGGEIEVTVSRESGEAIVRVTDTGSGISMDELPFIFERFHRSTDAQNVPGSGLGLSIVDEAIRRMNGTVSVTSTIGKGSAFSVHFPAKSD